ncbi:MAG: hypothetical protein QF554_00085 [Dehalococcoidia bacterium]|jgi:hypothetical protein|nr:hypothetical protein [Dehalococcoidia bacterium]
MVDGPFPSESEQEFSDRFRAAFVTRWGEERASASSATVARFARAAWSVGQHSFSTDDFPAFYLQVPQVGPDEVSS